MATEFETRTTSHFDRVLKKLAKQHPQLDNQYASIIPILQADPHNRTGRHPIKKLEGVPPGEGQYRIRARRFRFRYDIEGQTVFLKACSLRREDTY